MIKFPLVVLALATLASCGGDSATSDDYQAALDAAASKRAEALTLATVSPCNAASKRPGDSVGPHRKHVESPALRV